MSGPRLGGKTRWGRWVAQTSSLKDEERVGPGDRRSGRKPPLQPYIPYAFALAIATCTIWSVDVTSPALPDIQDAFGLSARAAGLIVSIFFIGRLLGNVPAARLLETIGSPKTASIGGLVVVLGAVISAVSPTIEVLYVGRLLQGIGIAFLVNAALRSILFARPSRGAAMTVYGLAATVGGVLGLQSSGLLTGHYGWRSIFALSAVLGVLLTVLPLLSTRVGRRSVRSVDQAPAVHGEAPPVRSYLAPLAVNFLVFCNYSIWVIIPLYVQREFDATPEVTANLLLIITITHLAAAVPVNRAIRRFGASKVLVAAVLISVVGTVGVLLASETWMLAFPLVLYGVGMVGAVNSAGDIVLHQGGAGSRAVGSLRQTSDLGLVIGPIVAGSIADSFSYAAPFIAFPVLMIVAAVGVMLQSVRSPQSAKESV